MLQRRGKTHNSSDRISNESYLIGKYGETKMFFLDGEVKYYLVVSYNTQVSGLFSACFSEVVKKYLHETLYIDVDPEPKEAIEKLNLSLRRKPRNEFSMVLGNYPNQELWDNTELGGILVCKSLTRQDENTFAPIDGEYLGVIAATERKSEPFPLFLWRKIQWKEISPPFLLQKMEERNRNFTVIQEGIMMGGSKQRMYKAFENIKEGEIVYAGPNTGLAQVALSIIGKYWGKRVTIFTNPAKMGTYTALTRRAAQQGAKIITGEIDLSALQQKAKTYCEETGSYLCPFGLKSSELKNAWIAEVKEKIPPTLNPKRLWISTGSGTILSMLYKIFPEAEFHVVQVGKAILRSQINDKTTIYVSKLRFSQPTSILPPYQSIAEYDAKVWEFFITEGKDEDYIWNVGY